MNKRILFYIIFLFLLLLCPSLKAQPPEELLNSNDRILIIAPHPDDETIGTAGIIQRAVKKNLPVKVVYLTYGDNNELSFLVYKKRPILGSGLRSMGEVRRKESTEAMKYLGLKEDQLIFLGYPDFGTQEMFIQYWGNVAPLKNFLTKTRYVPYKDAFSYQAPYKGESVLLDLKKILLDFKPTKIFVTLPADTNRDHRASYLFLKVALWDLKPLGINPQVIPYVVHTLGWPIPRGYHPNLPLDPPVYLLSPQLGWYKFFLTEEEIKKKKEAVNLYKSQNAYNPRYLWSFVRQNELFGQFKDIVLEQKNEIDWTKLELTQDVRSHVEDSRKKPQAILRSVTYAVKDEVLYVQLKINRWKSRLTGINVFLIGYALDKNFSTMPKLKINISFDKFLKIYDRRHPVMIKDIQYKYKGDTIQVGVPLSSLNHPDYILASVGTNIIYIPLESTAWRTLIVNKEECREYDQHN
jgi:LmbE family N-acetylglucosaminyl deacetylase